MSIPKGLVSKTSWNYHFGIVPRLSGDTLGLSMILRVISGGSCHCSCNTNNILSSLQGNISQKKKDIPV